MFLVYLPTAEQCLAEDCAGHVGLGSLLLCRMFRWQFQVGRAVRKEDVNGGKGQRKEEMKRIK